MSSLLATIGAFDPHRVARCEHRLAALGGECTAEWRGDGVRLVVSRKSWEVAAPFAGDAAPCQDGEVVAIADASLYARAELRRALAREGIVVAAEASVTALATAAYRAWGLPFASRLNGEFAIVLWDAAAQRLVATRDFIGARPLFVTRSARGFAVASSARALAELRGETSALNLGELGLVVSGYMWSRGLESLFTGVDPVPAGTTLVFEDETVRSIRHWAPPDAPDPAATDFARGAEELRALLADAVRDRMDADRTAVFLSGGWDSTSVFATAQAGLDGSDRTRCFPVSISYPEGDPGREDELIQAVADRWGTSVDWVPSATIPLFEAFEERCADADEPVSHLYDPWNSALMRAARQRGARIALDGCGGDNAFAVSDVVLADMLKRGDWKAARARLGLRRGWGWRQTVRYGVVPLAPRGLLRVADAILPFRVPRHHLERAPLPWLRPDFERAHALRERDARVLDQARSPRPAHVESMLYFSANLWSVMASGGRCIMLREGVELRSPLLDRRVVEFALRRPIEERASASESKRLLRRAMAGLLPDTVLAPRRFRTGVTSGYSAGQMRAGYPGLLASLLQRPLRLAELGIVEERVVRELAASWLAGRGGSLGSEFFNLMAIEFWLRSHVEGTAVRSVRDRSVATTAAA